MTKQTTSDQPHSRLAATVLQLCPRCRRGRVFAGILRMRESCPECGLVFGREPGYFTGAMYASYFLSVATIAVIVGVLWLLLHTFLTMKVIMILSGIAFLPWVPFLFRLSRVIWMHMDWAADPGPPETR